MRLEELEWGRPATFVRYSQYLRRSDGIWCRLSQSDHTLAQGLFAKFAYMYEYPGHASTGDWSHSDPLNALEVACLLQHCSPTRYAYFPMDARRGLRVPKDHFLPWTEEELAELMPIRVNT